jgi:hypothetical protein
VSPSPYLLITGIPRSGTTLTAALVDRLRDSLCLNEPPRHYTWTVRSRDRAEFISRCLADLAQMRSSLAAGGTVVDRREHNGTAPCNYFVDGGGRRPLKFRPVGRPGSGGRLLLALKHNEPFTAVLPELCELDCLRILAIVRHPVPTILSWQSRQIPLTSGSLSPGYRFWPEAIAVRDARNSVDELQVRIFELYCQRYWECRSRAAVVKYEDLIADSSVLERLTGRQFTTFDRLATQNHKFSAPGSGDQIEPLRALMRKHFDFAFRFYPDLETW